MFGRQPIFLAYVPVNNSSSEFSFCLPMSINVMSTLRRPDCMTELSDGSSVSVAHRSFLYSFFPRIVLTGLSLSLLYFA